MAKNIRRMFAMVLVMCMFVSALPMQALAAEEDAPFTTTDTMSGGDVSITVEPSGDVTVSGTNGSGESVSITGTTSDSGTTLSGNVDSETPNYTYTESVSTNTTNLPNGGVQSVTVKEGSETKEWEGDGVENIKGYEDEESLKLPSVEVELTPGQQTVVKDDAKIEGIVGDEKEGDDDTEYDYTKVTVEVDRTVTVNVSEIETNFQITDDNYDSDSKIHSPVTPEQHDKDAYNNSSFTSTTVAGRDFVGLRPSKGKDYYEDKYFSDGTPAVGEKPTDEESYKEGYDMLWSGEGESTWGATASFAYWEEGVDPYLRDEVTGEIIYELGQPVYDMEKVTFVKGAQGKSHAQVNADGTKGANGMVTTVGQFALKHENGEYFYAYCMDASTGTSPEFNRWYNIKNLEDVVEPEGGDEDENTYITAEEAAQIRAVALNGYWGTESGQGSVESLKQLLKNTYLPTNEDASEETDEESGEEAAKAVINIRYPGSNDAHPVEITEALFDGLTEAEALAVTQAAIWALANKGDMTYNQGNSGVVTNASVVGVFSALKCYNGGTAQRPTIAPLNEYTLAMHNESDARMQALYCALLGLEPIYADSELREDSTVIPQEDAITDLSLVIEDRVAGHEQNLDDNNDNDVYNVALNFQLAFTPGENDELYIELIDGNAEDPQTIYDANNNPIKKLVSHDYTLAEGENEDDLLRPNKDGVYTLSGLELSENSAFTFDLHLSGTQYLENGVYIYQAHGGRTESQTLVGLAEGEQYVSLSNKVTIDFNVDENNHVVEQHIWRHESDPVTPPSPPEYPVNPVEFEEAAPQVFRLANQNVEEIPEEPVPLAAPVITGDNSGLWIAVILLSIFAMAAINLFDKKRQQETF